MLEHGYLYVLVRIFLTKGVQSYLFFMGSDVPFSKGGTKSRCVRKLGRTPSGVNGRERKRGVVGPDGLTSVVP